MKIVQLRKSDLPDLSSVTAIPLAYIEQMYAMNMINHEEALMALIKQAWRHMRERNTYSDSVNASAIAARFNVSVQLVRRAKRHLTQTASTCFMCSKAISRVTYNKYNKMCASCYGIHVASVEVPEKITFTPTSYEKHIANKSDDEA